MMQCVPKEAAASVWRVLCPDTLVCAPVGGDTGKPCIIRSAEDLQLNNTVILQLYAAFFPRLSAFSSLHAALWKTDETTLLIPLIGAVCRADKRTKPSENDKRTGRRIDGYGCAFCKQQRCLGRCSQEMIHSSEAKTGRADGDIYPQEAWKSLWNTKPAEVGKTWKGNVKNG
jgi:hypothetical protein